MMGDGAYASFANPKAIVTRIRTAITIIDSVFTAHGLTLSYKVGKTKVLLFFGVVTLTNGRCSS